ncbi:MAG: hypothetical protein O3A00_07470 [Planctomycetota bacterium]|nr:hypothetical protein [Planctomycetota bacterium]
MQTRVLPSIDAGAVGVVVNDLTMCRAVLQGIVGGFVLQAAMETVVLKPSHGVAVGFPVVQLTVVVAVLKIIVNLTVKTIRSGRGSGNNRNRDNGGQCECEMFHGSLLECLCESVVVNYQT